MSYTYIITSEHNNIAQLVLNRPDKHNALCIGMVEEINHYLQSLLTNETLHALFVLGNEKAFCAGGDLKEMKMLSQEESEKRSQYVQSTFKLFEQLSFPVISLVRGICFGGGLEMVLHCDTCICTEDAQLALPEVKYGMIPGAGGVTKLPLKITHADAMHFLLTGENIPLTKAFGSGLVQKVILSSEFNEELVQQESYYASANLASLKAIKEITQMHEKQDLEPIYAKESAQFAALLFANGRSGIDKNFKNSKK